MAIAVAVTGVDNTQKQLIVDGTLTLSGNYVAHGDAIDLTGIDLIKSQLPPTRIQVYEQPAAGASASGYVLVGVPGAAQNNGVLQVFETGAAASDPLSELAAGAYPAGLTGAVIKFTAWFPSFV
jgi:hypothetical protein